MLVRQLHRPGELLAVLDEATPEMLQVRALLSEGGCAPCRRTWERRLGRLPETLPAQIGCLSHCLVEHLQPWRTAAEPSPLARPPSTPASGVWRAKHRAAGVLSHTSIDTEAHWTKSGWHGWVSGWKLHLVSTVASVWTPLAAELTPANVADNELAPRLLTDLRAEVRFVLGDLHYNAPNIREVGEQATCLRITPQSARYPHTDAGIEVRLRALSSTDATCLGWTRAYPE
jgi:Transposase DDE domain